MLRIERDRERFRQIVRGRIKRDLRRYMSTDEIVGRQGDELVSIPIHEIDIPRFMFGPASWGGVGQGEGEEGTVIGADGEDWRGGAGDAAGQHMREVEVSLDELAELLGEELELPRIEPRGTHQVVVERLRYTGISRAGPESLRHFRRTYRQALRRHLISGTYDPQRPRVVPIREDRRYRTTRRKEEPQLNAAVFYLMDVSGSMGDEQKEIVRLTSFWIDTWLRHHYKDLVQRYVVHDAVAHEVDRDTFYRVKESGGTKISSAYELAASLAEADHPYEQWNVYVFHFSDGDNWGEGDTERCLELLRTGLLPRLNLFGYGQVASPYGSGQFIRDLGGVGPAENLVLAPIAERDAIYDAIRAFLGKGK